MFWTILLIFVSIACLWPHISRWIQRLMLRRAEDMMRKMAGMPTRKEEQRAKKQAEKTGGYYERRRTRRDNSGCGMQEYAEDVEYQEVQVRVETETQEEDFGGDGKIESQVTDAEYIEIKE